jgi:hypothetical protein
LKQHNGNVKVPADVFFKFAFYIFISVEEAKASLIQSQGHFTSVKKYKGGSLNILKWIFILGEFIVLNL